MANFISGIISLTIGVVVLANVFISTVKATDTNGVATNWTVLLNNTGCDQGLANYSAVNCTVTGAFTTAEVALWGLLSLIGIAGIIYGVMSVFGMA